MDQNAKAQAVERIKEAQNVLITVSTDPSIDQLSAAIGLTLLLNKLDKRATAVFSGEIPSTLEFLRPEDTIEQTTDSLRDFIVSLDKAKADKLRYKVEDEVVRIFITPYKTKLTEEDLIFSQGDFNVDVVLALGIDNREHIDQAIMAHGRILHDATVVSVMAGEATSDVGSINWQDPNASSLCEMLMSISESLKSGTIDNQIATAFLTGIVAMTDRFKNEKTTPKVMTMSAQLMAAGANQQLIAAELTPPEPEEPEEVPEDQLTEPSDDDDESQQEEGVITLHHDEEPTQEEPAVPLEEVEDDRVHIDDEGEFSNVDQLREVVEQVQQNKHATSTHEKRIEPLPESDAPDSVTVDEVLSPDAPTTENTDAVEPQTPETTTDSQPPIPGQEIQPSTDTSDDTEISLPSPVEQVDYPPITGQQAAYLENAPTDANQQDEFVMQTDEELPSIEPAKEGSYSKFLKDKPTIDKPLNATNDTNAAEMADDPLASIPQAGPVAENYDDSPLLSTQHDAESPRATEVPSTEDTRLSDDGETGTKPNIPLGPNVSQDNTLSEIEANVENFENQVNEVAGASEEDARQAVMEAISQAGPSEYEPPQQNIGAQFVPLDSEVPPSDGGQSQPAPEQEPTDPPPSVPPPIMPPQFPIPGAEVYEPSNEPPQPR